MSKIDKDFDVVTEMMRQAFASPFFMGKKAKRKSCKKRKLEYIREKNRLRNGGLRSITMKTPVGGDFEKNLDSCLDMVSDSITGMQVKYKLPIKKKETIISLEGDDFAKSIQTILIKIGI